MTVGQLQNHLDELCDSLYCRLDQAPNKTGMMYVEFGYVEGPSIDETDNHHYPNAESRYLVCLHEFGHFRHNHTQGRPWNEEYQQKAFEYYSPDWWENEGFSNSWYFLNGVLKSEAEAWNYALDKCIIPSDEILPETRAFMWDRCLGSYFNHAREVGFETPGQLLYNGDRAYVPFAYGKPDKYFFQTKRRILEGDIEEDLPVRKKKPEWVDHAINTVENYQNAWNTVTSVTYDTNGTTNIIYRGTT